MSGASQLGSFIRCTSILLPPYGAQTCKVLLRSHLLRSHKQHILGNAGTTFKCTAIRKLPRWTSGGVILVALLSSIHKRRFCAPSHQKTTCPRVHTENVAGTSSCQPGSPWELVPAVRVLFGTPPLLTDADPAIALCDFVSPVAS